MSYNIQTAVASVRPHHYLTRGWKHVLPHSSTFDNLDRIARLIGQYDIVALQEADAGSLRSYFINQVEYLARRGQFAHWFHQTNRDFGKLAQQSNGLLSKLPPGNISQHRLPGLIPGRGAMVVNYGHRHTRLALILVHLALGRRARQQQLAYIAELLGDYRHAVVMGDFNCPSHSPEMEAFLDQTELCAPAEQLHTFPSWRPMRNIDHILVTPSLPVTRMQVLNHVISDHLPIAMELEIPAEVGLGYHA
ncbi:MAG TPA: EEP domain-containing protein [Gammaproteobacteria bacterium]|nr:EEP domain-containing protein [Gammaproteobacteria bacterium]